jgi:hypothetical protein
MTFGPDGKLYVAEAGHGGDEQSNWVPPFMTAKIGNSGRIIRIDGDEQTVIASGFQSVALGPGAETVGVDDLAFMGSTLYAVVGQANALPGGKETFSLLVKVGMDGKIEPVADLGKFERDHNPDQTVPDSNPFGIAIGPDGNIYVADAGGNDVLKVTPDGQVSVYAVWKDNPVPTSIAFDKNGVGHTAFLTGAPFPSGGSRAERINDSSTEVFAKGLTAATDLKIGPDSSVYVLEHATSWGGGPPPVFTANTGRVLKLTPNGNQVMVAGLHSPTKMTFGPDGALYIANNSSDVPPNQGQVVKVMLPASGPVAAVPSPQPAPAAAAQPSPAAKPSAPAAAASPAPVQAPSSLPRTGAARDLAGLAGPLAIAGGALLLAGVGLLRRRR